MNPRWNDLKLEYRGVLCSAVGVIVAMSGRNTSLKPRVRGVVMVESAPVLWLP
jgi:hypothetical protein